MTSRVWRIGRIVLATLLLAGSGLALDAFWIEPASLRVEQYAVALKHAPPPLAGMRIAVITDLHAGAPYIDLAKIERVVALTNAQQPDLIVLPGDIFVADVIGESSLPLAQTVTALAGLRARLGVYLVFGNHEYKADLDELRRLLAATQIQLMDNAVRRISDRGQPFWLIGLANVFSTHADIHGTLAQVNDDAPILMFTHSPDVFPKIPERVNLVIAGHTHGGQLRLPFYGRGPVPSHYGRRFAAGHVVEQTDLFVATGIGTSRIPVRFGVPPEIALLTLSQAPLQTPSP